MEAVNPRLKNYKKMFLKTANFLTQIGKRVLIVKQLKPAVLDQTNNRCAAWKLLKGVAKSSVLSQNVPVIIYRFDKSGEHLVQLCKMLLERNSCINLQKQNFGSPSPFHSQCRPEDGLTRRGGASICRQCFLTCDVGNAQLCFDASSGIPTNSGTGIAFDVLGPVRLQFSIFPIIYIFVLLFGMFVFNP